RDLGGQPRQPLDLGGQRGVALAERRDLPCRAVDAVLPRALLQRHAGEALAPHAGLAQETVVLALGGELDGATLAERGALARQRLAAARRVGQLGQAVARRRELRRGLGAVAREAFLALGERGEARLNRGFALDQRVVRVARDADGAEGLAHRLARRRFRRCRGGRPRRRRVECL